MRILCVDIGTGTQDILLFDSDRTPENCLKMVMPSPTLLRAQEIRAATAARQSLLLTGSLMGGGPSSWAVEAHRKAGLAVYSEAAPAQTLNDDLVQVQRELGIELVSSDEARALTGRSEVVEVIFRDFDLAPIADAMAGFGVTLALDAVALAVFDHGAAPPDVSDRQFRMDYLAGRLHQQNELTAFSALARDVPPIMTRLATLAAAGEAQSGVTTIVMDTAPAAVLGATDDPVVGSRSNAIVVNVGNFHTLAFQFSNGRAIRLFEHHTGLVDAARLAQWLRQLADGTISHSAVFADHGHGALVLDGRACPLDFVAVTGPRQALLSGCGLPVYVAVPHGDQMMAGCYGLLRAAAAQCPDWREAIESSLNGQVDRSLW